ncbi:MAG TPA: T9SS type A sorting domain-containing protein [Saprospiraceae bacterium]|nr:T9SS type A sorting domain-containing protein [Saprospiraceae bacterium]
MKNLYTIFIALLLPAFAEAQTWVTYTPPFGDTIGIADIEVVNENVTWAVGLRYGVDDSLYYYGVGNETYYAVTSDGGASWKTGTVPLGATPFIAKIAATDAGTAMIAGLENFGNAKTIKTVDGGTTWQVTPTNWDPVTSWPDYIHAFSPAKYCVIGDPRNGEFEILLTFNAGQVWQPVDGSNIPDPLPGEFGYNNCGAAIGNTIWFGTNQGRIYRSQNSGGNWEVFTTPLGSVFGNLAFSDENNGLITTSYGFDEGARMYRTADGGATWAELTNMPYGGNFLTFNTAACVPNSPFLVQGLAPGNNSNLTGPYETWISPDRGDTWQQVSTGEIIGWPTFISSTVGWAGDFQQLSRKTQLYKYTGSPLVGLFSPNTLNAEVILSPNPASDVLRVKVQAQEAGDFWILLNDAQGKLVRKETENGVSEFEKVLEIKNLSAGTYTLTVTGAKGSLSRQFVKQ